MALSIFVLPLGFEIAPTVCVEKGVKGFRRGLRKSTSRRGMPAEVRLNSRRSRGAFSSCTVQTIETLTCAIEIKSANSAAGFGYTQTLPPRE